jgi:DNA polymerase V
VLDGEFTVKRLAREAGRYFLKPEHPDYAPIPIEEGAAFMVWGVVTNVIHKPYEL